MGVLAILLGNVQLKDQAKDGIKAPEKVEVRKDSEKVESRTPKEDSKVSSKRDMAKVDLGKDMEDLR